MTKGYKPERPVTSDKIRQVLSEAWRAKYPGMWDKAEGWKRKFKARLPDSRKWVRGYVYMKYGGIAISDETDTKLLKVYIVEDAQREFQSLGVLEIILAE